MNLLAAQMLANEKLAEHGLILQGWKFEFDHAVRRYGSCSHKKKCITLSEPLTLLNDYADINDTVLHEIAHALVGSGHGHDAVWKDKCVELGCRPIRCGDGEVTPAKYQATCVCGKTYSRINRVKRGRKLYCLCQNKKSPKKYLVYTKV